MSTYAVSLATQVTANVVDGRTQGFRLIIKLTVGAGFVDAGLFLYLRSGAPAADIFQAICSPQNLTEYPLAAPGIPEPFLRLDNVDLVFSSQLEALEVLRQIQEDLKVLCDEMAKLQTDLTLPAITVIADDVDL